MSIKPISILQILESSELLHLLGSVDDSPRGASAGASCRRSAPTNKKAIPPVPQSGYAKSLSTVGYCDGAEYPRGYSRALRDALL
jgi:hypothetical protein